MQKSVTFVKKNLKIIMWDMKNIGKLEIIVNIQRNLEVLPTAYVIENIVYLKKVPIAFHNGSSFDYNFIIKELELEKRKFQKVYLTY